MSPESEPRSVEDWAAVESLPDFVAYLRLLHADFQRGAAEVADQQSRGMLFVEGRWRHPAVGDYFDAWSAWLSDMYVNGAPAAGRVEVDPPSWSRLAFQLWAAGAYE